MTSHSECQHGRNAALQEMDGIVVAHADQQLLFESMTGLNKHGPVKCSKKKQSRSSVLRKQTHLHLQSRSLVGYLTGSLENLVPNVQVAFLQGNKLTHVPAISKLSNLTMLYLQVCLLHHLTGFHARKLALISLKRRPLILGQ
jgi:hypothetical protein